MIVWIPHQMSCGIHMIMLRAAVPPGQPGRNGHQQARPPPLRTAWASATAKRAKPHGQPTATLALPNSMRRNRETAVHTGYLNEIGFFCIYGMWPILVAEGRRALVMCLWLVVTVLSLRSLVSMGIQWLGRIHYEHARAALATDMSRAVAAGGFICDERADGSALMVIVPPAAATGPGQPPFWAMVGDIIATPR